MNPTRWQRWAHDKLGWHRPVEDVPVRLEGINFVSRCSMCAERILQDSHGGWFLASRP